MKTSVLFGIIIPLATGCVWKDGSYLAGSNGSNPDSVYSNTPEGCAEYCWFNNWCNFFSYNLVTGYCLPLAEFEVGGSDSDWMWGTAECANNVHKAYSGTRKTFKDFSNRRTIQQSDEIPPSVEVLQDPYLVKSPRCFNNLGLEVPCAGSDPVRLNPRPFSVPRKSVVGGVAPRPFAG